MDTDRRVHDIIEFHKDQQNIQHSTPIDSDISLEKEFDYPNLKLLVFDNQTSANTVECYYTTGDYSSGSSRSKGTMVDSFDAGDFHI